MRRLGVMPYMTPLQRATESSRMPKSVMKTTVGGGCAADCCARTGIVARNSRTSHKQKVRVDFAHGINVILIKSNSPKRLRWSAGRPRLAGRAPRVCVATPSAAKKWTAVLLQPRSGDTGKPGTSVLGSKVEQSRVPEGRHSSCDTVSPRPSGSQVAGGDARLSTGFTFFDLLVLVRFPRRAVTWPRKDFPMARIARIARINDRQHRLAIVQFGRLLHENGFVAA